MAEMKWQKMSTAETLQMIQADDEAPLIAVDSSSDDEDLFVAEGISDDSDPDYRLPTSESDEDYEGPSSSAASSPTQPPQPQPGPSSTTPTSSDSDVPQERLPKRKRKALQKSPRTKRGRSGSATSSTDQDHSWHNKEKKDTKPNPPRFMPSRTPGPTFDTTASWSPLTLFQLFFSASVVRTIIDNTNSNAAKRIKAGRKFVWKTLTTQEFYIFMAIILYTGLVQVHLRSDYWRKAWPYNFHFPSEKMSRSRFEAILWSLHLSNPEEDEENERKRNTDQYDRLFKIKPLYTEIVTACQANFHPYKNICIDERMVASKARSSMKQYMKDKPIKWGYKLFVLADASTAYTWNFFVYSGKKMVTTGQGLSYTSVMDLLPFPLLGSGYNLFVDNFYSSPALFLDLHTKHIGCCGTIRRNLTGFPHTTQNDLHKKAARGDMRWIREGKLLFVKWMDTRGVSMCSTIHEAFSGHTVKRKVKEAGVWQTKDIPIPDAVVDYNKNMGGVDVSDALIGYYTVHHKTMKWYKTFFYHFIDIAVVNSFLLHKELFKMRKEPTLTKPLTQKIFRERLAAEMLSFAEASAPPPPPPPPPQPTCMPMYYGGDATQARRYCRRCQEAGWQRVKTPIHCRKCQVPLCLTSRKNCFQEWHDSH
ncbi:piggyBac transposable element-derived protein 4-like [Pimephales promelas]|uniref:piggyBac transposable element-derived protein 4-like n=1 Tax=Pimephales promelas TaxID=90988 RepID=UPI0019555B42|nr:piggyBac transposable element-derived protein 4-like [Pimephales promelas]